MEIKQVKSSSSDETLSIAKELTNYLKPGQVVTLKGELGTGKTVFAKGIASGLGIKEHITSPTFTIIKEYEGRLPFYHMDVYRLEHSEEDLGFSEYFYGEGITIVEWPQFIEEYLPKERLNVTLDYKMENTRLISIQAIGNNYKKVLRDFSKYFGDCLN